MPFRFNPFTDRLDLTETGGGGGGDVTGPASSILNHIAVFADTTGKVIKDGGFTIAQLLPLTTKGDIYGYDTGPNRIPVGTNGQVLTANSAAALGVAWTTSPNASQLTPDAGGAVTASAGNINVFGQKTVNAQSMMTNKVSTNFIIEDRTWFTGYVVDPSTAAGLRGTFSTVQSAITAIIADGIATASRYGLVKIRAGTYAENITMTGSQRIYLQGMIPEPWTQTGQPNVFINGTLTYANGNCFLENVGFIGNTAISSGSIFCYNSFLNGVTGAGGNVSMVNGELRDLNTTGTTIQCKNVALAYQSFFAVTAGSHRFESCYWTSGVVNSFALNGNSSASFNNCDQMVITGSTTGNVSIQNTGFQIPPNLPSAGRLEMSGNYRSNFVNPVNGGAEQNLFTFGNNNQLHGSLQGNITLMKKVATDYTVTYNDYYIGITDTSATWTMTLPSTAGLIGPKNGQVFIFKDESGLAGTNNITIAPNGGTIDGGGAIAINTNYGFVKLIFDGTNYFTIT